MENLNLTSTISFLYYQDMEAAKHFFSQTLGLEIAYNPGWSCVFKLRDKAYIGCVDASAGSITVTQKGGFLTSLTVSNLESCYARIQQANDVTGLTEIKKVKGIPLQSFFFTGPEGYQFEIQQFSDPELNNIF